MAACLAAGLAGADELADKMFAECEAISGKTKALQAVWCKVLSSLTKGAAGYVDITLKKVVLPGEDLRVFGVHQGDGKWVTFEAWFPREKARCVVKRQDGLSCTPAGEIRGTVEILVPKVLLLSASEDRPTTFALAIANGKGTWESDMTKGANPAVGRAADAAGSFRLPADYILVNPKHRSVFGAYADATTLERLACRFYRSMLYADVVKSRRKAKVPDYPFPLRPEFISQAAKAAASAPKLDAVAPAALDDLGDLDTGFDLGDSIPAAAPQRTKKDEDLSKHPDATDRLSQLKSIGAHIEALHGAAEAFASGNAIVLVDPVFPALDDKHFGPWIRMSSLASGERGNVLPSHRLDAPQQWQYVDDWEVLGPWPEGTPAVDACALPARLHVKGVGFRAVKATIPRDHRWDPPYAADPETAVVAWQLWFADEWTGILRPPNWWLGKGVGYSKSNCGIHETSWYGATEIKCKQAGEYWVATGVDDDGQLWINDTLVAAWPDLKRRTDLESPIMFRFRFKQGTNRILLRVRQGQHLAKVKGSSGFWMRICTAGGPMNVEQAAQRNAKLAGIGKLSPFPKNVRGWRANWTGVIDGPTPPTAWSYDNRINILWETSLPHSMATPVVVGGLVIAAADPYHVVAVDKQTGDIKWRKSLNVLELLDPVVAREADAAWDEYFGYLVARQKLASPDDEMTFRGKTVKASDAWQEVRGITRDVGRKESAALKKAGHVGGYLWSNYMGPNPSTPVTDGKHIWAWGCQGAAACFDLEGNRKWLAELPHRGSAYGAFTSPLLVDGKLILEVVPEDVKHSLEVRPVVMLALDAETGKEVWRAPVRDPAGAASPAAMRVGNGDEEMTVIITAGAGSSKKLADGETCYNSIWGGTIVRADDGHVLVPNMSVSSGYGTPVVDGDIVYHCSPDMQTATEIIMIDRDTLGTRRLWTRWYRKGFEPNVSVYNGHLHALFASPIHGGQGYAGYGAMRADTGEMVPRHVNVGWGLFPHRDCRCYPPSSIVNGFIYHGDTGEGFGGKGRDEAYVSVLEATPQGRIIAQNDLPERTDSALAFDGDRIYYRNGQALLCIGYTGDEGRAYEARENARQLLDDFPKYVPTIVDAVPVAPFHNYPVSIRPCAEFWGRPNHDFFHSLTVRGDRAEHLFEMLGGSARFDFGYGGKTLIATIGGKKEEFRKRGGPFDNDKLRRRGRYRVLNPQPFFREMVERGTTWDFGKGPATVYLYHMMRCKEVQAIRFIVNNEKLDARMWLNGVPLKHQGRYLIEPGDYGMLTEMAIKEDPEDAELDESLMLDTYFVRSAEDPDDDVKAYEAAVAGIKPYLERVIQLAPDSEEARRAKAALGR